MSFYRDSSVSAVLKSSCIYIYTPVLRAALPCSHNKNSIYGITLEKLAY